MISLEPNYSMKSEAMGLLEHLNIEKARLIGTSYGGEVGMKFAALYPESTLSLSIIDSVSETYPIMEYLIDTWISATESGDGEKFFNILVLSLYSTDFIEKTVSFSKTGLRRQKTSHLTTSRAK